MTTVLSSSDKGSHVTVSGNLTASNTFGVGQSVRATTSNTTGKWYFEAVIVAKSGTPALCIGLVDSGFTVSTFLGGADISIAYLDGGSGSLVVQNVVFASLGAASISVGNVVGVAIDFDTSPGTPALYFSRNNVWQNSANPTTGAGAFPLTTSSALFPALTVSGDGSGADTITVNFGETALTYTPPSGYSSWDTLVTSTGYPRIIIY